MVRRLRHSLIVLMSVMGPGLMTAIVDNDAGGIYTYSHAGARWGYLPLWTLLPLAVVLIVSLEMAARLGAVTGKGLADLIREEFGLRVTFFVLIGLVGANLLNVAAQFAGIATCTEMFGLSRNASIPLAAGALALIVLRRGLGRLNRVFLAGCVAYLAYVVAVILARPNWSEVAIHSVQPAFLLDPLYLTLLMAMIGTSVAPWMQFYLQDAIVEKGIGTEDYAQSRLEVIVACILTTGIAFFILVACADTIHGMGPRDVRGAADAALALKPLGSWAQALFAIGLLNASVFAATVLPRSTAHTVCEGLGFESGPELRWREAPYDHGLAAAMLLGGAAVALFVRLPLVKLILWSQVANALLLPVVLGIMLRLARRTRLMKTWRTSWLQGAVGWTAVVGVLALAATLLVALVGGRP